MSSSSPSSSWLPDSLYSDASPSPPARSPQPPPLLPPSSTSALLPSALALMVLSSPVQPSSERALSAARSSSHRQLASTCSRFIEILLGFKLYTSSGDLPAGQPGPTFSLPPTRL